MYFLKLKFLQPSKRRDVHQIKKASSELLFPWERCSEEAFECQGLIVLSFPGLIQKNQPGQDLAPDFPDKFVGKRLLRFLRACPSTFLDKNSIC